jgi:thymidylate synthase
MRSHFGRDQIQLIIDKLQKERDAKSAVINLWDVEDHIHGSSPCLNHLWFRILDDRLILSALFRSHDVFGAWVSNAFGLRSLQQLVAKEVEAIPAELIITSQSCHVYEHSIEAAKAIVADHYHPKARYDDPAGSFIIEVNKRIEITQTDESGMTVRRFSERSPLDLVRQVVFANPQIRPDHAAYLGMEVQKAWQAKRNREPYIQDK